MGGWRSERKGQAASRWPKRCVSPVRRRNQDLANRIGNTLDAHSIGVRRLVGVADRNARDTLLEQLIESVRRVEYVKVIRTRNLSPRRADPRHRLFNPLKAAILAQRRGELEEAFWLVFLFVHFGKHQHGGWNYVRAVYGRLGGRRRWDWPNVCAAPQAFRTWLHANRGEIERLRGGFGNHRKYESLDAWSQQGTGAVVESYVRWVNPPGTHMDRVNDALLGGSGSPRAAFDVLYKSMNDVVRFGRTARFDYLCMVSKLGLAGIEPGSPYMTGATGPVAGARLLFAGDSTAHIPPSTLNGWLIALDADLGVGMQVIEDALCNWQKSPREFVPFRG